MSDFFAFLQAHPILSLAFMATAFAWAVYEMRALRRGFKAVSPQLAVALMNRQNALVVDVRENNEFLKGHLAGAVNVPASDFSVEHKHLKAQKDRQILICDQSGTQASKLAQTLRVAGFTQVALLDGGIDAWRSESLPTERGR